MRQRFRYVTYENNDGLANRLRLHCLAQAYAFKTGRTLVVDWQPNEKCYATYSDLFVNGPPSFSALWPPERWLIRWLRFHPTHRDCHVFAPHNLPGEFGVESMADVPNRLVHFEHDVNATLRFDSTRLGPYRAAVTNSITARPQIVRRVSEFLSDVQAPRVGLHIRMGDFVPENSSETPPFWGGFRVPLNLFIDIAHAIIARQPRTTFILVSDGSESELLPLLSVVKCNLRLKVNNRTSLAGVQDALADLLVLGSMDFVVGTPYSSFNEFASFLGNKSLVAANAESWRKALEIALEQYAHS